MKKLLIGITSLVVVFFVLAGTVLAGTFRSPNRDTTCDGSGCDNATELAASASSFSGVCVTDLRSYIAWDLATDPGVNIANAKLILTTSAPDGTFTTDAGTYAFALVQPNNHTWTVGGSDPGFGPVLATSAATAVTAAGGQQVVFQSDALGTYFNGLRGGTASVGVIMTSGCAAIGSLVLFQDKGSANEPDLIFYTSSGGNAVTLSTFRAADPTMNWPLIVVVLLLVAAVAGFGVYRWRVSQVRAR